MSLWAKVQFLSSVSKQLIFDFYQAKGIPIEVRQNLPIWIENNFLSEEYNQSIPGNEEQDAKILQLCSEFFTEIERTAQISDHGFLQIRLRSASLNLQDQFSPTDLFSRIKDCLNEELRLLEMESSAAVQNVNAADAVSEFIDVATLSQKVCDLVNHQKLYESMVKLLQEIQIELNLKSEQLESTQTFYEQISQCGFIWNGVNCEADIQQKLNTLRQEVQNNINRLEQQSFCCMESREQIVLEQELLVRKLITNYLERFKWSDWGLHHSVSLDDVQRLYGGLIDSISDMRHILLCGLRDFPGLQMQNEQSQTNQQRVQYLVHVLQNLYGMLISNAMVVEEQPSQDVMKETKLNNMKVRFLCGEKHLPQHCQPMVKVLVINEAQASLLYNTKDPCKVNAGCGKIINNVGTRILDGNSFRLIHQFCNVAISNVREDDKKEDTKAMSKKFGLIFFTQIPFGENFKMRTIWCCSVPFVFRVSSKQRIDGEGTIFWDNYFRKPNRTPFSVPEQVPWSVFSTALNRYFKTMANTEWDLTETNLRHLGEKFFQNSDFSDEFLISRRKFLEKECPSMSSLWEWFHSCIELTNKHLKSFWDKGYIIGFIDKFRAENILSQLPDANPGTFMLRFSDSTLGGISVTYVDSINGSNDIKVVNSLSPFTDKDLKVRSLEDRLNDVVQYHTVYHQGRNNENCWTSKSIAFVPQKDTATNQTGKNTSVKRNYVKTFIIMVISSNQAFLPFQNICSAVRD